VRRLLADENIPRPSILQLREQGHDVEAVAEFAAGMHDTDVLAHARDHEQILLTFDRDFGELLYRRAAPAPAGVIYLRFVPASPEEPAQVLQKLFAIEDFQLTGRFTVINREHVRQRPLLRST
jgi:predicted nuclease of predicted toxin-antitoxin system